MTRSSSIQKLTTILEESAYGAEKGKVFKEVKNPFPGLRPFNTDETHLFFGREEQVDELIDKLATKRFVATLGASGSGKSSLIYCGLIPALQGGYLSEAGSEWKVVTLRPGISPIKNLANAVLRATGLFTAEEVESMLGSVAMALLEGSSKGLVDLISRVRGEEHQNFLILVDQFEEIFRFSELGAEYSYNEAAAFVRLLLEAIRQAGLPIHIVLTMRSDYIGDCARFPELTNLINDSHYLIPQMTREEQKRVILGPVAVAGADMSPRLVQRILNDLNDDIDQLPILQHALMRTWEFWQAKGKMDDPIDLFHYDSVGGIAEALSRHADEAYAELTAEEKEICTKVFKTLTEKGGYGRGTRRPTQLAQIASITGASIPSVVKVLDHYRTGGRTFITPFHGELADNDVIDISHESLMRIWRRCKNWVDEEAESAKMYLRLSEAAMLYQQGKTSLWRPPDLQLAIDWQDQFKPNLAWAKLYDPAYERAMVFLRHSKEVYDEEQRTKSKLQKLVVKRTKIIALTLAASTIVAIMLVIFAQLKADEAEIAAKRAEGLKDAALQNEQKAKESAEEAELQKLNAQKSAEEAKAQALRAQEALRQAEYQRNLALAEKERADKNAQEATEKREEAEKAQRIADENFQRAEEQMKLAEEAKASADTLRFLSIAKSMAVKSLHVKKPETRAVVAQQAYGFNTEFNGYKNQAEVFTGLYEAIKSLKGDDYNNLKDGHSEAVNAMLFDKEFNSLYSMGSDGRLISWQNKMSEEILYSDYIFKKAAISDDANWMAIATDNHQVILVDLFEKKSKFIKVSQSRTVRSITYLPSKKGFLLTGRNNILEVFDIESGEINILNSDGSTSSNVAYDSNKDRLISSTAKGIFAYASGEFTERQKLFDGMVKEEGTSAAVSPDGKWLAVGYENGIVGLWNLEDSTFLGELEGHNARVTVLAFSSDSKRMATGSLDGSAILWSTGDIKHEPVVFDDIGEWVNTLTFGKDNKELFVGSLNKQIKRYNIDIESLATELCEQMPRSMMTEKEWFKYVGQDGDIRNACEGIK